MGSTLPSVPTTNRGVLTPSTTSKVSPCLKVVSVLESPLFRYLTYSVSADASVKFLVSNTVAVTPEDKPLNVVPLTVKYHTSYIRCPDHR